MADKERGLELEETAQQMADIAITAANRWQDGGLTYTDVRTCLLMLTRMACVEIVATLATEMRDPSEFARSVEGTLLKDFGKQVVERASAFKSAAS